MKLFSKIDCNVWSNHIIDRQLFEMPEELEPTHNLDDSDDANALDVGIKSHEITILPK